MVKVTILSDKKGDDYHTIVAFYDFASETYKESECDNFVYSLTYELDNKKFNSCTTHFSSEQLKNLKDVI